MSSPVQGSAFVQRSGPKPRKAQGQPTPIKRIAGSGTETTTSQFYRLSTSEHINRIGSIIVLRGERETLHDFEKK
jgi:hypothetical protein